jgi:hypothetical protein
LALKDIDGNDFSASNPGYFPIGNAVRAVTGALSVTKNAGTNWCNAGGAELATKEVDYFVYFGYNATDGVTLGFSRIPYATLYSDFSTAPTAATYAAISNVTNAAAGDSYVVVGRFAATLSAGAGYAWSVPTFTNDNLIQKPIFETRRLQYTPQWTNLTIGNGTQAAYYKINLDEFTSDALITLGSTSSISGSVTFAPIISAVASYQANPVGLARLTDAGIAGYAGIVVYASGAIGFRAQSLSGSYLAQAVLSSTVPFTWGASDAIDFAYRYRIK